MAASTASKGSTQATSLRALGAAARETEAEVVSSRTPGTERPRMVHCISVVAHSQLQALLGHH